jgi:hypothetical protein
MALAGIRIMTMKRLIAAVFMFGLACGIASADQRHAVQTNTCIFKSSYTATSETAKYIPNSQYLARIIVSSATAGGWVKVYDSTWTASGQFLPAVNLGAVGVCEIGVAAVNGITYTSSGNTNGVSFIYREHD